MERLYILYDAQCGLCSWAKRWLMQQPAFLDLSFIPAGSLLANRLFPGLTRPDEPPEELVVVSDEGGVYREGNAWIMCLFALDEYREWANRLSHPLLRPLARQGFALLSRQRSRISRWLSLASDLEIAATLRQVNAPACAPVRAESPRDAGSLPAAGGVRVDPIPPASPNTNPNPNHDVSYQESP
jgi:predicted DCC family thiol-disulfide oxidoreductase YuxK